VGQEIVVDFQLDVGMIGSSVGVSAETRGVSLAYLALSYVVSAKAVLDLPGGTGRLWRLSSLGIHTIDSQMAITADGERHFALRAPNEEDSVALLRCLPES
jgi:hypothetical protein